MFSTTSFRLDIILVMLLATLPCNNANSTPKVAYPGLKKCPPFHINCFDANNTCLDRNLRCNGVKECPNGSDEKRCRNNSMQWWECDNGKITHIFLVCNGTPECEDESDEKYCIPSAKEILPNATTIKEASTTVAVSTTLEPTASVLSTAVYSTPSLSTFAPAISVSKATKVTLMPTTTLTSTTPTAPSATVMVTSSSPSTSIFNKVIIKLDPTATLEPSSLVTKTPETTNPISETTFASAPTFKQPCSTSISHIGVHVFLDLTAISVCFLIGFSAFYGYRWVRDRGGFYNIWSQKGNTEKLVSFHYDQEDFENGRVVIGNKGIYNQAYEEIYPSKSSLHQTDIIQVPPPLPPRKITETNYNMTNNN